MSEETKEILARRTEKMWRHEDREINTSYALWNIVFAIHAAMIGAVGIFIGNDKFPLAQTLFPYVFTISIIAMILIVVLIILFRRYDTIHANHFRAIHMGIKRFPTGFNPNISNRNCRKYAKKYYCSRMTIEITEILLFIPNAIIFAIIVMTHT